MLRGGLVLGCALALSALGCGGGGGATDAGNGGAMDTGRPGTDGGPGGNDAFVVPAQDAGSCTSNTDCPGTYCNMGTHACCSPTSPPIELCGDHIDQNCDGHDESCGDNDHDHFDACTPTSTDLTMCDCDDTRADTYPALGSVPGGPELCDMYDNDCDGRIDESAMCCSGCAGISAGRADACTAAGECDCLGEPGTGPCAAGQLCCTSGCVDPMNDIHNCGGCHSSCDASSDRCTAGMCMCGTGSPCSGTQTCPSGSCV